MYHTLPILIVSLRIYCIVLDVFKLIVEESRGFTSFLFCCLYLLFTYFNIEKPVISYLFCFFH